MYKGKAAGCAGLTRNMQVLYLPPVYNSGPSKNRNLHWNICFSAIALQSASVRTDNSIHNTVLSQIYMKLAATASDLTNQGCSPAVCIVPGSLQLPEPDFAQHCSQGQTPIQHEDSEQERR